MHAHSYREEKKQIIPYNISIDATIEYRIIDPLIVYYIEDIDDYVKNKVHLFLHKNSSEDLIKLQKKLNWKYKSSKLEKQKAKIGWINKINNFSYLLWTKDPILKNENDDWVIIEKVVLSSFDNLFSHRSTQ